MFEVRSALRGRNQLIDSGELAKNLLDVWGGPRRLAEDIFREYTKAAVGSVARQRNLEMVMRLIVTNTTHDIVKPVKPSDLTDEELGRVAAKYMTLVGKQEEPGDSDEQAREAGSSPVPAEDSRREAHASDSDFDWFDPDRPEGGD
jgi:hypothetical protein